MGATETVCKWVVNTSYENIPPEAIKAGEESYFDCLGLSLSGSVQPLGRIIHKYVAEQGGKPEATVLGSGLRVPVTNAALANGTFGCAMDLDPGPTMVGLAPALLGLGEQIGASGRDILEAFIVGFELFRVLEELSHDNLQRRGLHAIGGGRMAVATACAKLLKLDHHQTAMAMGLATSTEAGLVSNEGTMTKPLHAGLIGKDGVMAACLVELGFTGLDHVLDHPSGWYGATMAEGIPDMNGPANKLGNPFRIQDSNYIRQYPCCRTNHTMLDSILGLMREHQFDYRDVESLEMDQLYGSIVMLYLEPKNEHEARFSALFNAAAALVDGKIGIDTFTMEKVNDPVIKETMGKVRINVKSRWQERPGDHQAGVPVSIRLKDGRILEHITPREQIRGSQQNPFSMDEIVGKFRENASLALSADKVDQAIETWWDIDQIVDVREAVGTLVANGA